MYKLSFEKRVWIVKQVLRGMPRVKAALSQSISDRTVRELMNKYELYGWGGLKDHKTGRSETVLNQNAIIVILDLRTHFGYGACRIEQILKQKGFAISHRQIEKVLIRKGMVVANPKKQKPRKWVRYELPHPNDLWHTDWSYDPFTGKQLSVYIDDRTRLITCFGVFQNAEQENTLFRQVLDPLSIKHCLARINRPQTNGKVERFFRTYKEEFAAGSFKNIADFMRHYNENRPHMSLLYKTPKQVWEELKRK